MQSLSFGCFDNKFNETKMLKDNGGCLRIKNKTCTYVSEIPNQISFSNRQQ